MCHPVLFVFWSRDSRGHSSVSIAYWLVRGGVWPFWAILLSAGGGMGITLTLYAFKSAIAFTFCWAFTHILCCVLKDGCPALILVPCVHKAWSPQNIWRAYQALCSCLTSQTSLFKPCPVYFSTVCPKQDCNLRLAELLALPISFSTKIITSTWQHSKSNKPSTGVLKLLVFMTYLTLDELYYHSCKNMGAILAKTTNLCSHPKLSGFYK